MPRDDRFKKYQEAGADFLEMARTRAEDFLSELAQLGDSTQKQAQDAFEEMVEGSRRGTEQMVNTIRAEIASQLSVIGIATRKEMEQLERRLTALENAGPAASTGAVGPARKAGRPKKAAPTTMAAPASPSIAQPAPAQKAAAQKTAAQKTPAQKTAAQKTAAQKTLAQKAPAKKVTAKKAASPQKAGPARRPAKKATGGA